MMQSYKHFFKITPPHLLNCVKTSGIVGILGLKIQLMGLNLNQLLL